MFCALNGATATPWRASHRQIPATSALLPASEVVPATNNAPRTAAAYEASRTIRRGESFARWPVWHADRRPALTLPTVDLCGSCCGLPGWR